MKTETTTSHYRQHAIHLTTVTPTGSSYAYTVAADDVTGSIRIDGEEHDTAGRYTEGAPTYTTPEAALKATQEAIENILGPAEAEEIQEAAEELGNVDEDLAERLKQTLESYTKNNGGTAESALAALVKGLSYATG